MQFIALIYNDPAELEQLPPGRYDEMMRGCFAHADELKAEGRLSESRMLDDAKAARSIRVRNGRKTITDGPFAEAKEVLGGFNLIEADSMEEAVGIASGFPWAQTGCVEVRAVRNLNEVRASVGATSATAKA